MIPLIISRFNNFSRITSPKYRMDILMLKNDDDYGDTDFKELSIQRVTEADFDCVKKFLLIDFLHNEPLSRSINLTAEDSNELFNELINVGIASSLSYILRAPDGKIAALRLASILDRPDEVYPSEHNEMSTNKNATIDSNNRTSAKTMIFSPKAQIIADILHELESKVWILINPRLKRLLLWSIVSVHKDYTRRGLAEKCFVII
ncbi:Gnat family protein [Dirofilaria immitis]|nr:Gnat family protein [Dirofilaria immitis]